VAYSATATGRDGFVCDGDAVAPALGVLNGSVKLSPPKNGSHMPDGNIPLTMPGSTVLSQVTVRLLLSETGNLVEVRLVRSGGDPILDQNVVFAVKQSNFPIPPVGSTILDRTFMVTYVYR